MLKVEFTHETAEGLNAQVADYMANVKKKRSGKDDGPETANASMNMAPAPIMPPATGFGGQSTQGFGGAPTGFAPPAGGAAPVGGGFPAPGAQPGPAPEVAALVQRIVTRMDAEAQSGQTDPAQMLQWFRNQCGPDAAQATKQQIQQVLLPRMAVSALTTIAQAIAA